MVVLKTQPKRPSRRWEGNFFTRSQINKLRGYKLIKLAQGKIWW